MQQHYGLQFGGGGAGLVAWNWKEHSCPKYYLEDSTLNTSRYNFSFRPKYANMHPCARFKDFLLKKLKRRGQSGSNMGDLRGKNLPWGNFKTNVVEGLLENWIQASLLG